MVGITSQSLSGFGRISAAAPGQLLFLGEEPLVFRVQGLRRLLVFLSCLGVLCDCEAVRVLYAEFRTV